MMQALSIADKIADHCKTQRQRLYPDTNIDTARQICYRPDDHLDCDVRTACRYMRDHGDWMDDQLARVLIKRLNAEAEAREAAIFATKHESAQDGRSSGIFGFILGLLLIALAGAYIGHSAKKALPQASFDAVLWQRGEVQP